MMTTPSVLSGGSTSELSANRKLSGLDGGIRPVKFYKKESQEKNVSHGWNFSCFAAHLNEQDSVLTGHTVCSVAGHLGPAIGVFSTSGFHRSIATKPVSSETSKPERRSNGDHSSIWDSWPMALSGYPRGPRVGCETTCPRHTAPNFPAETRSRTRASREPTATAREDPRDGADLTGFCLLMMWAMCWGHLSKTLPLIPQHWWWNLLAVRRGCCGTSSMNSGRRQSSCTARNG
jgi:hypothetical protein